jgi:hypothetical protein
VPQVMQAHIVKSNPTRGIEPYRDRSRERFLTPAEVRKLGALCTSRDQGPAADLGLAVAVPDPTVLMQAGRGRPNKVRQLFSRSIRGGLYWIREKMSVLGCGLRVLVAKEASDHQQRATSTRDRRSEAVSQMWSRTSSSPAACRTAYQTRLISTSVCPLESRGRRRLRPSPSEASRERGWLPHPSDERSSRSSCPLESPPSVLV